MDHDQRFKALIREFFGDFLQLFFADWAARFDLKTVEWLETESLPNPPEGSRHQLELVARVHTKEQVSALPRTDSETWLTLIHIEIESRDQTTRVKPRLPVYYIHLRQQHGLPVLPIVLYLRVGLDGIGVDAYEETLGGLCVLRFQYLYVGLPGLSALDYVEGDNWLGVALSALMKIPRDQMVWLGGEALRRLSQAVVTDQQRFLLGDCIEAYLGLDEVQMREFKQMIENSNDSEIWAPNKTRYDRAMEEGACRALLALGRKKFAEPSTEVLERIQQIQDLTVLESLVNRTLDVSSWEELLRDL